MPRKTDVTQTTRPTRGTRKTIKEQDLKGVQLKPSQHDYHNKRLKTILHFVLAPPELLKHLQHAIQHCIYWQQNKLRV